MDISYDTTFDLGRQFSDLALPDKLSDRLNRALEGPQRDEIRSDIEYAITMLIRHYGVTEGERLGKWEPADVVLSILDNSVSEFLDPSDAVKVPVRILVNLCNHAAYFDTYEGMMVLPKPHTPARVDFIRDVPLAPMHLDRFTIPVFETRPSTEVRGLPRPIPGIGYLVSRLVYDAHECKNRDDLYIPHLIQRTADGDVTAAHALAQPARNMKDRKKVQTIDECKIEKADFISSVAADQRWNETVARMSKLLGDSRNLDPADPVGVFDVIELYGLAFWYEDLYTPDGTISYKLMWTHGWECDAARWYTIANELLTEQGL